VSIVIIQSPPFSDPFLGSRLVSFTIRAFLFLDDESALKLLVIVEILAVPFLEKLFTSSVTLFPVSHNEAQLPYGIGNGLKKIFFWVFQTNW
jgi:hypothetical protein